MELFRIKKDIPFMRHALIFNVISAVTFVAAVFFLLHKGLNFSVEFTGGTVMEVSYAKAADVVAIRKTVEALGFADVPVQTFGKAQDVVIRLPLPIAGTNVDQQNAKVFDALKARDPDVTMRRTELVGAQVGDDPNRFAGVGLVHEGQHVIRLRPLRSELAAAAGLVWGTGCRPSGGRRRDHPRAVSRTAGDPSRARSR